MEYSFHFMKNIFELYHSLINKTYIHGQYYEFKINDPKPRLIHKATIPDRLVHHLIYSILSPFFEKFFIYDSFSCRIKKGTHKANKRFNSFIQIVSKNNTQTAWILKCDIRKFFANIHHDVLLKILRRRIDDIDLLNILEIIIKSFHTEGKSNIGLPIGNVTSQLFVNIYMNEFDQYIKRHLKIKYYIRYSDDFVILDENKQKLLEIIPIIKKFLDTKLHLSLHPNKLYLKTISSGIDFLGWIHFSKHTTLRTSTKKRMLKNIRKNYSKEKTASYLGMIQHGNTYKIRKKIF